MELCQHYSQWFGSATQRLLARLSSLSGYQRTLCILAAGASLLLAAYQYPPPKVCLRNKRVVITGASSGIGEATARLAARRGANVIVLARTESRLEELASSINAEVHGKCAVFVCDCTDPVAVSKVVQRIQAEIGVPDVIINCAGLGQWRFTEETSDQQVVACMAAPYFSAFFVTKGFLPRMLERRSGQIVNVNSPACFMPWSSSTAFASARWALRGFNDSLRMDVVGTGLTVHHVVLGTVKSGYWTHNRGSEERFPRVAHLIPRMSCDAAARVVLGAVESRQRQVVSPFLLHMLWWLHQWAPSFVELLVSRTGFKRRSNHLPALGL